MSQQQPLIYLARHGETAWSLTGQHTGLTDLSSTEPGKDEARKLRERLTGINFDRVFTSPLQRSRQTCDLAGFGDIAAMDHDLVEWNYGDYEGKTSADPRTTGWLEVFFETVVPAVNPLPMWRHWRIASWIASDRLTKRYCCSLMAIFCGSGRSLAGNGSERGPVF